MDVGTASSNVENVAPNVLRRVLTELSKLIKSPPEGISICEDGQNLTDIEAVVEGPVGTPYAGGKFHVRVVLGKDFPAAPPKCFFTTKIFHPNVSSDGSVCVNTLKRDWEAKLGIQHILLTIKCLLIVPNPESALNEEAGKMLLEHYDDYWQRARMMTEIHAQPSKASYDGPSAKKHAGDKKVLQERKKTLKDKKRTLKRL